MIDRQQLLSDLQSLLKRLEADLLERSESTEIPDVRQALRAEYERAKKAERTAQNYEDWRSDAITQAAAAWVLSCVFVRFLEDNKLIDPPKIAGPKERLQQARDEHTLYFQDSERAKLTDREYLLSVFDELAKLPGTKDVFGEHNPIRELPNWLSGDAAGELLRFFQKIDANTGDLIHDFTDPPKKDGTGWDTRFLGDLYQDLSEAARKKYALLQTPEFVEEFILDRTLDPALDEFGLEPGRFQGSGFRVQEDKPETRNLNPETYSPETYSPETFRLIDPACGSGHFLLGAFRRIADRWERHDPGAKCREVIQRALDSVYGVDVNPYAVAIARFRLLLAALKACGVLKLADAPAFRVNVVCGDSLYHGRQRQQMLGDDWTDEAHYFAAEDAAALRQILREGTYHCVVANPPYITPKDRAANQAYRKLYPKTCHRKYSLSVPFMERLFRLGVQGSGFRVQEEQTPETCNLKPETSGAAGYVGQITSNSFMKREFGKKLIESFFPNTDLTHVIDTSGAYIPGHGTPTVILFGRHRKPLAGTIRTVMGIRGEPSTPHDPSRGLVWSAIVEQVDQPGSQSEFVSVNDSERERFHSHPWSIGGGGAAELKEQLEEGATETLSSRSESIGFASFTGQDDAFVADRSSLVRSGVPFEFVKAFVVGDTVRDWMVETEDHAFAPYDLHFQPIDLDSRAKWSSWMWLMRTAIGSVLSFGGRTRLECGDKWWTWYRWIPEKYRTPLSIVFAFVATHNHFVLDRGGKVFKQSAPVIKLPPEASEDDHLALLGLLNSSTACFWMKQIFHDKGSTVDSHGARQTTVAFENFREFTGTGLLKFPLPAGCPTMLARRLDELAQRLQAATPGEVVRCQSAVVSGEEGKGAERGSPVADRLHEARSRYENIRGLMIFLQEELDWACYRLYGLIDESFQGSGFRVQEENASEARTLKPETLRIFLGQRAFEIVLARKMAAGETPMTWFERHGSTPITELPAAWPDDYRELVQQRIALIESDPNIGLIEQPEYKRRWNTEPWESQVETALRAWLLDRLETYFDFDGRMNDENQPTAKLGISLTTIAKLTDVARQDAQFLEVAEVYRDDPAFDVQRLVEQLVKAEQVPLLPVLRYKPAGLRKRKEWEKTWELQREEDEHTRRQSEGEKGRPSDESSPPLPVSPSPPLQIPVPPKYKSSDFISTGGARYWALRGKLDVPKERWVSFPHCEGPDGTLVIAWAGYDHLQLARAISAYFVDIQQRLGGAEDPRLVPLLACIIELLPWLKQWHHDLDPDYNQRMDEVFEGFVTEEAKNLGLTIEEIKAWQPPKKTGRKKRS